MLLHFGTSANCRAPYKAYLAYSFMRKGGQAARKAVVGPMGSVCPASTRGESLAPMRYNSVVVGT